MQSESCDEALSTGYGSGDRSRSSFVPGSTGGRVAPRTDEEPRDQHGRDPGHDLLLQGFTVSQVVHNYGDVCQSVTALAMETNARIATEDFRTLNKCLDDAIASAVTEHARGQQVTRDGQSDELQHLTNTAIAAFEVLQTGTVGAAGTTGALVHRSLMGIRALIDRPVAETAQAASPPVSNSER